VLLAQALFGHPQALLLDEPTNHLDLDSIHWLREFLVRYEGTLIVISHDRHFLNASARTRPTSTTRRSSPTPAATTTWCWRRRRSARGRVENAQREKKIAQLQDFIARFGAGTRASQTTSRRKEVERLQTTELARSNIQRPYIKFTMNRPSAARDGVPDVSKAFGTSRSSRLRRDRECGEKSCSSAETASARHAAEGAAGRCAEPPRPEDSTRERVRWGHEFDRLLPAGPHRLIQKG
jgi:ATPase subunit of ABC transporter with duplicated ATPase domains